MKYKLILFSVFLLLLISQIFIAFLYLKTSYQHRPKINSSINAYNQIKQFTMSSPPLVLGAVDTETVIVDNRINNLKRFFRKYNSPLYDEAEFIVQISDQYGFDYRLLPAIAMQESNLCKVIPENSYNCWGWGIYGDQVLRFPSYKDAISAVAKGIKKDYIDKGLHTPESIMSKYTPSSPGTWSRAVNFFMRALE